MNLQSFYDENKDFHDYVERYRKNYECMTLPLKIALSHELVKNYASYLKEVADDKANLSSIEQ